MKNILKDPVQKRILLLVVFFFVSTAVLIVADSSWRWYQHNYESKIDNQIARRDLCESILRNLLMIQRDFYQLNLAEDSRDIRVIRNRITKSTEQIKSILGVLQNGGEFTDVIPTNIEDVDEIETSISFYPDKGYILEVITLTPLVLEIEDAADKIAKATEVRINASNEEEQLKAMNKTTFLLKKAETVSLRSRESANRIFYTSSQKIESLVRQEARISYNINIGRFLFITVISIIEIIVFILVFFKVRAIITERKQVEEDLKKNEKKYRELSTLLRLMADNMPDMLWAKNLNNEYIFVNKAICTDLLNAKDTDEPLGKTDIFFATRERNTHPDNPKWHTFGEVCRDSDAATLEAMKPMHFDEFGNVKGKFLFLDVHKALLYDSDRQLIGVVGSARDVTAAKEAENQLLKLSTALKQSPSPIAITDTKGNLEYVNPKFTELTGYSSEEAIGLNLRVLKSGELDDEIYKELWETISSGKIWRGEFHNKNKNGEWFWEMASMSPIFDEQGKIINYVKVAEDITRRRQAEEELAAEKERLAVTLRSIGDGVITTDIEGRIVSINKVAEDLTGWSNEDARGKLSHEVFSIVNEKTGQKCANPVSRVLDLGRIVGLANHTALITKNGAQISITDSGAPIRDAESKIIGVIIVFRDVTHERRIEEELLKTRKLESVGVLAGGIAHDFNNILAVVSGNIELASLRVENDNVRSLLSSAQKATNRATKLTQQLLTFSKGGDPVKEKTSLSGLIQESADFVLHGSKVGCEYSAPDDLWMVDADSGQLSQVIQNIIINAMQAMPEGGKIQINCSNIENAAAKSLLSIHDGSFVCIRIQDTGIGIPKEIIDKIFDPYYTTKQQGSGLGLAICHSIINKHDGHISVQSTPGKGTTFSIYLPAVSPGETTAPKVPHTGSAVRAARIMVMDDEEMVRDLVKAQLTMLGHEAVLVADGEQAINEYQKLQDSGTPVDLVIMDLTIPGGMSGQEAAKRLLQVDPRAKIIVASGYSNDPVMAGYREYGFCAAVAKPFDLAELRKGIESALS